jgi:hypothetical protein
VFSPNPAMRDGRHEVFSPNPAMRDGRHEVFSPISHLWRERATKCTIWFSQTLLCPEETWIPAGVYPHENGGGNDRKKSFVIQSGFVE